MFEPFPEPRRVAQNGRVLTIPADIALPATRCLFCAGREHVVEWEGAHAAPVLPSSPGKFLRLLVVYLLCPIAGLFIIPLALLAGIASRPVRRLKLPRCGPCADRHATARLVGAASAFVLGALIPIGSGALAYWTGTMSPGFAVYLGVPGAACAIAAVLTLWVNPRMIRCVDVDERTVTLIVPNAAATAEALTALAEERS